MKILLANIGNRNLQYGGDFISKDISKNDNFFEQTKLLYEEFDSEKEHLKLNILDVLIDEYQPKMVYLFVTHQPEPFRQDTYYEGLIIQKLLEQQGVQTYLVEFHSDPRDRDQAFSFFENFFLSMPHLKEESVVVSGSGGVPAMKEALNFYAVASLKNPHIVDVDEHAHRLMYSNVAQSYLKKFQKETLLSFIDHHNYSGAYLYLKSPVCLISTVELERKLLYLESKYNFDFAKANRYADDTLSGFEALQMINEQASIDKYLYQKKQNLIYLLDNLEITYKKWEYTSLLGKIYALKENFARWKFEDMIKSASESLSELEARDFAHQWQEFLDSERPYVLKRQTRWEPTMYYLNINERKLPDESFIKLLEALKKLHGLRNSSIMAHGFEGASKEKLDKENIFHLVKELRWKTLGQKKNKFDDAEQLVKNMIMEI